MFERVSISKGNKKSVINRKWLPTFIKDGWIEVSGENASPNHDEIVSIETEKAPVAQISIRDAINECQDKSELEALMVSTKGVNLDKRKSLDNMKADALETLNES